MSLEIDKMKDRHWRLKVNGIKCGQTPTVIEPFKEVLSSFDNIIEIGSNQGGFTIFLYFTKNKEANLVSYDISKHFEGAKKRYPNIDFRIGNCFNKETHQEIKDLIQSPGKTLLLCDGGNKIKEFNTFSSYLKSGDVIMLHDYGRDKIHWEEIATNKLGWKSSHESSFNPIEESINVNSLSPFMRDEFESVLWGSFIKK